MSKRSFPAIFFVMLLVFSCKDKIATSNEVYNNDFQADNLSSISGGIIENYNGSKVLGRYNNGGFTLSLNNLPKHDLISVSFTLYIHDSWDGNSTAPDGPDMWEMFVDDEPYISTTFSNFPCASTDICKPQSYPNTYPNNYNNPQTGATTVNLPPACKTTYPNGTSMYRITKTFAHTGGTVTIKCLDKLSQTNDPDPKCDESWSVDNLNVKAITL